MWIFGFFTVLEMNSNSHQCLTGELIRGSDIKRQRWRVWGIITNKTLALKKRGECMSFNLMILCWWLSSQLSPLGRRSIHSELNSGLWWGLLYILNLPHSCNEISHIHKESARKSYLGKYKNKKPLNRGVLTAVNIKELRYMQLSQFRIQLHPEEFEFLPHRLRFFPKGHVR